MSMENCQDSMNQPRKPQESFLASTSHNVVQSTSMKNKTDETLSTCEKSRKMPTIDSLIEKSIFLDYEKDSTTKPLDYGKLSRGSINQPRKLQERFLASKRDNQENVVQSTSREDETDETIWDICEKIRKLPTATQLLEQVIFRKIFDYEKDFSLIQRLLDYEVSMFDYANDSRF
ncbi:uncharacterized protein LOC105248528 [Camponotus floridanus]|uniref:uncharacterized protein LOC105248528 n=1 Tax=Camponotus floridanus TaxID=104421 RepID=UPI00059E263B|nr:uncharacterized protein LOC105248528 [Camponotus floridanus]